MDGDRITGPTGVSDAAFDREIESLLGAEPSPEFVARVRARVADEPVPGGWRPWMLAMAGAVALATAVLIVWPSSDQVPAGQKGPDFTVQRATESVQPVTPQPSSEAARVPSRSVPNRVLARGAAKDRVMDIELPEVVIADNEVRTFAALVATIRERRFDVAVPAAPDLDAPLEVKELRPAEPIEIEPIVKLAVLQAEGERP